jgi:hypothetical protein
VSGDDGRLSALSLGMTSSGGVTLSIVTASDSKETYDVSTGSFSDANHHSPIHDEAKVAGSITEGCVGWRVQTKKPGNGLGTWTETEFGVRTGFPGSVPQPPSPTPDDWTCSGAPLTNADVLRRKPAGSDSVEIGTGQSLRYEERHRSCHATTGCSAWTPAKSVSGDDGHLARVAIQTRAGGGLTVIINSVSDSAETLNLDGGTFSATSSFHAPDHSEGAVSGIITEGCMAWSIPTKQSANGNGTWTETMYGVKTSFPAAIR